MKLLCTSCGKLVNPGDVGARIDDPTGRITVWCLPCWDDEDSDALVQYLAIGDASPQRSAWREQVLPL